MKIERVLKKSELFSGLSDTAEKKLEAAGRIVKAPQGMMIFLEGEKGSLFYLLMEGSVRLFKSAPDGREITLKLMSPGEIFGEVILFEQDRYPASATAVSDSSLFAIDRASFNTLLDGQDFRTEFISIIMKKQRYLVERILYLTALDVEERFFRFLLEHYGRKEAYEIPISKKDLASAIGTIPETLSRLIQRLSKRNIIRWEGSRLELADGFWEAQEYD
ncbi:MAG: Crp/Fnr family transcriptional regulator [Spirochaetes bacterium]|nr:Crp/Fnr family transcriptional regulator [Spirochaetota bacterium]